jgi:FtsZ-binding cell division protein ZapB
MDEFRELKVGFENLEIKNKKLVEQITETVELIKKDVHPDEELVEENRSLRDAIDGISYENIELKQQLGQVQSENKKDLPAKES